ncbi:MAG TPA: endonuclease/exonuclease/phosphatase family protein [Bacteroidales bacterium]|nr:endonuclease/exonuclease/phosphatase family protein [Bacteroidales bacterium]
MKKLIYRLLLTVNILIGVALLISYLAVHINPIHIAFPAFFGLAYPYLLLANILLIIIWAMMLRLEALISLVIIIIGFNHFLNYIQLFKTRADKGNTFKVMSYNVHLFNYLDNKRLVSQNNIYEFISTQKPDILLFQEFFTEGSPSAIRAAFNTATGLKYNSHIRMFGNGKNRYYGIVTLTRFPIINKGEVEHPGSSSLTIYSDIIINKDTFRVYNNYLQSFRLKRMERSFIAEITSNDDKESFSEVTKNLYSRLRKGFISRSRQAQAVKDHIKKSPYPVIVSGDFNDTPVSYAYRKIRKGLNDSFVNSGYGAGFTYKGNYPPNRIDYILYDDSLINNYFEIIKVKYSDHYPVTAFFRLRN